MKRRHAMQMHLQKVMNIPWYAWILKNGHKWTDIKKIYFTLIIKKHKSKNENVSIAALTYGGADSFLWHFEHENTLYNCQLARV